MSKNLSKSKNPNPATLNKPSKSFKIIDISLPLYQGMINYPGNQKFRIRPLQNKTSFITAIHLGSHTGTHVDSPRHVFRNGKGVDQIQLKNIIGRCRVLDMTRAKKAITVKNLKKAQIKTGERILVKTKNSLSGFKKFSVNYIHLDGDAAEFLASRKITLFGIDYLSVKQKGSSDVRPHTALLKKHIPIFEGLDLSKVKAGRYFFIGLPLRLVGLDGSPARAVLLHY